jgi:hypothetical protein
MLKISNFLIPLQPERCRLLPRHSSAQMCNYRLTKEFLIVFQSDAFFLNVSGMSIAFHLRMFETSSSSSRDDLRQERNAMISYSAYNPDTSEDYINFHAPKRRYAWLEQEGNMWHFLTSLFADPAKSTRKWSNKQRALEELTREGWTVLYPYPELDRIQRSVRHSACGYGLMWIEQ